MRINFGGAVKGLFSDISGGSSKGFDPLNIIFSTPGTFEFDKTLYPDYNTYEVIVIAGGGGYGGAVHGVDPDNSDYTMFVYGGAGGAGGFHRVKGLLEILSGITDVFVGGAGANGTSTTDPDTTTDGNDGDFSAFGDVAVASPGFGGKRAQALASSENSYADGGLGGIGGVLAAVNYLGNYYAGGQGGIAALSDDPENPGHSLPGVNGQDGKLVNGPVEIGTVTDYIGVVHTGTFTKKGKIGQGGGGGAGGWVRHDTVANAWVLRQNPTNGGRGSYDLDEEVYSPYGPPQAESPTGAPSSFLAGPGRAGGARATPFTKSNATYGDSGKNGLVIVRLTAE